MGAVPTFRSRDGLEIYYRVWGDADGDQPPVVLHHGFGAHHGIDWEQPGTVAALTAVGRQVVALDARGHGRSEKPHDPARYGEPLMSGDVSTLLDVLDVPSVDLVGYSMGAVVTLVTAVREPRVRRIVVGGIGAAAVELGGVDRTVLDPATLRAAMLADDPSSVTDPAAAAFRAFADQTGADRLALAAQAAAVHAGSLRLEAVTVPALVLAGRDDPLARRPEVLAAALRGSRLLLVDGDHGGVLQEPAFRAAIAGYLADEPPPASDGR